MKIVRTVLFILIVIGLIWLLVLLFTRAFSGNKAVAPAPLVDYAGTSTVATMYIDGPVVANQEYRGLLVTVGRDEVTAELMNGYKKDVVRKQTFASNQVAYAVFLKALQRAGFNEPIATNITKDERGICPQSNRFIYTLENGQDEKKRMWTSRCGGNYQGQQVLTRQLFLNQVPRTSLSDIVRGSGLSLSQ